MTIYEALFMSMEPRNDIKVAMTNTQKPRRYRCVICDHIYDPAEGDPEGGIQPGTPFESIPDTWVCPECGASKADYEPLED